MARSRRVTALIRAILPRIFHRYPKGNNLSPFFTVKGSPFDIDKSKEVILGYHLLVTDTQGKRISKIGNTTIKDILNINGKEPLMPYDVAEYMAQSIYALGVEKGIKCLVKITAVVDTPFLKNSTIK